MSGEFGEAAVALLGIAFGGVMLLRLAPHLNQVSMINITAMGVLYLLVAVLGAILLVWGALISLTR
ncbi:hypothetical protein OB955_00190 [Halobacteria archaeon AArc-m2/3/4]|uniref:Uncharacterized protein n=1 Tax=Natronoglomus mannanivorans TaxID=2979990 RepID=A0ABT2Q8B3_9EURY|nr:hypothetical protein [Halobacteria archaeon AArc-m2/3/4]